MSTARLTEYSQYDTYLWQVVAVDNMMLWRRKNLEEDYSAWKRVTDGLMETLSVLEVTFQSTVSINDTEHRSITSLGVIPASVIERLGDDRWLESLFD